MADIAGPKTTTTQTMQDYMTDYATNVGKKADPRGGFFSDNTPEGKENNLINNINFAPTFAPTVNKKTMFDRVKQLLSIASYVSPHTLAGKIGLGLTTYDRAKTGLQAVSSIADTFGINTDSITNSLSNNFSGKKSNTTTNTNTNNGGDKEGLASLKNQASGYDEYVLLLQKLQSGNITDEERTRYTMLKNMLGI